MTKRVNWSSESVPADMATQDEAFLLEGGHILSARARRKSRWHLHQVSGPFWATWLLQP